jgi:hypothetical protein
MARDSQVPSAFCGKAGSQTPLFGVTCNATLLGSTSLQKQRPQHHLIAVIKDFLAEICNTYLRSTFKATAFRTQNQKKKTTEKPKEKTCLLPQ